MICAVNTRVRVMLAVVGGNRTINDVLRVVPRSRSTVHGHLVALRDEGLIAWDEGKQATIRPLYGIADGPWLDA